MGSVWKLWHTEVDGSTWGPKPWPATAGWQMPTPKVHVLRIPPFPVLKTPETNLRSTRHPSLPANPQSYRLSRGERPREEHSPVSPLFTGPKRSDGMMADKRSPSQSDSPPLTSGKKQWTGRAAGPFEAAHLCTVSVLNSTLSAFPSFLIAIEMEKHLWSV